MICAAFALPGPAQARSVGRVTGLAVPRFAALRSDIVNLRVGPGRRFPIQWVLHRRALPVEILHEFKAWRSVRIPDGTQGWVHASTLTRRRSLFIKPGRLRTLRAAANRTARPLAHVQPGVVGRLLSCPASDSWCQVEIADIVGYLPRDAFWGAFPAEAVPG